MTATTTTAALSELTPIVLTTNPASGDPVHLGHYLNLGLGDTDLASFLRPRPAIPGRVAAALTVSFLGGVSGLFVGVWGSWSANAFDPARVFSDQAVMPAAAGTWGAIGVALLAVFAVVLLVAVRATAKGARAFDAERAALWAAHGGALVPLDGLGDEAEDVVGRLGVLAGEADVRWSGSVPSEVRGSFAAAVEFLAAGSVDAALTVLDGVAGVLEAGAAAPAP